MIKLVLLEIHDYQFFSHAALSSTLSTAALRKIKPKSVYVFPAETADKIKVEISLVDKNCKANESKQSTS